MSANLTPRDYLTTRLALAEGATEGPWDTTNSTRDADAAQVNIPDGDDEACSLSWVESGWLCMMTPHNAEFIADARTSNPVMATALIAVLDLHHENGPDDNSCQGYTAAGYGDLESWCVECSNQSGREYGTAWPCATYQAITDALGADK